MAKLKNRCRIPSCKIVIGDDFKFCYMHRKCKLKVTSTIIQEPELKPKIQLKRHWCDQCGMVIHGKYLEDCPYCGFILEELD